MPEPLPQPVPFGWFLVAYADDNVHRTRPLLCDGDGPIPEFRRYFSQFYATTS